MAKIGIKASFRGNKKYIETNLSLLSFVDDGVNIVYSPALDLSGYGYTENEARKSFEEALNEFFRYTTNKVTLLKELKRLGWKISGGKKKPKIVSPDFSYMISENEDLQKLYNEKEFTKFNEKVKIPELV
jgi:hypothetical protein